MGSTVAQKAFAKLSKLAPSKGLKTATKNIAKYYGEIADGQTPADVSSKAGEAYGKGIAKFGTFIATGCIASSIPDIPGGGSIPDIPGT